MIEKNKTKNEKYHLKEKKKKSHFKNTNIIFTLHPPVL